MTWIEVVLILGLGIILLIGYLASSRDVQADVSVSLQNLKFKITVKQKSRSAEHLRKATLAKGDHIEVSEGEEQAKKAIENLSEVRSMFILWVDDHPENNAYEILMLGDLGFRIIQATSTAAAEFYLREEQFDLMITDLAREDDSAAGMRLIDDVRKSGMPLPIIVYTLGPDPKIKQALQSVRVPVTETPGELLKAALAVQARERDSSQNG